MYTVCGDMLKRLSTTQQFRAPAFYLLRCTLCLTEGHSNGCQTEELGKQRTAPMTCASKSSCSHLPSGDHRSPKLLSQVSRHKRKRSPCSRPSRVPAGRYAHVQAKRAGHTHPPRQVKTPSLAGKKNTKQACVIKLSSLTWSLQGFGTSRA